MTNPIIPGIHTTLKPVHVQPEPLPEHRQRYMRAIKPFAKTFEFLRNLVAPWIVAAPLGVLAASVVGGIAFWGGSTLSDIAAGLPMLSLRITAWLGLAIFVVNTGQRLFRR